MKPRDPVSRSPLMRKGGVHEKTKSSKRRKTKSEIEAELEDWREAVEFEDSIKTSKTPKE